MISFTPKSLGKLLVESKVISEEQLMEAVELHKKTKIPFDRALIEKKFITEENLMKEIGKYSGIKYVDLYNYEINQQLATSIPKNLARLYSVIPVSRKGNKLILAMADPMNIIAVEDVGMATGLEIEPVIATETAITNAINQCYGLMESAMKSGMQAGLLKEQEAEEDRYKALVEDAPIVRVVNSVIQKAVNEGASDIHIEPTETGLRIRIRVDGVMFDYMTPPDDTRYLIISRIKIMSKMDISERRLPQDGQINMDMGTRKINIRVSTLPTVHGEKVVLRLLDKEKVVLPLHSIGFSEKNYQMFHKFIKHPNGIILLTGPTGCGKTTTLYSTLNYMNRPECNIITLEDPVEYRLEGINQVQVNPRINFTFANALRSILRQDPDIVMVGEMRDLETAEIGTRAALTGHLVFSTLHTNNAAQAVTRLLDMGVPPYLVASSLLGVVAQRLVRRICEYCKIKYQPSPHEQGIYETIFKKTPPEVLFRGEGCGKCRNGYRERTAIHEIQPVTGEMREMIITGHTAGHLWAMAKKMGMKSLPEDGLIKVEQGETTLEEIMRVSFSDI